MGYEPEPDLQALIAALSAGPVLPGDAIGRSNVTLINMTCRADGLLLKPDRPAFPTDADFVGMAFDPTYNTTVGRSSTTLTSFSDPAGGNYTLVMNLRTLHDCNRTSISSSSSTASPRRVRTVRQLFLEAGVRPTAEWAVVTLYYSEALHHAADMRSVSLPRHVHLRMDEAVPELPPVVPACGYVYLRASPCIGQLCVLGELDKWVSMSRQRVSSFTHNAEGTQLLLDGHPGESVHISYSQAGGAGEVLVATCQLPSSGRIVLDFQQATFPSYNCSSAASAEVSEDGETKRRISVE